jgi:hypothetical protein
MTAPAVPIINFYTPADKKITVYYIPSMSGNPTYTALFYSTNNGTNWYQANTKTSPVTITTDSIDGSPLINGTEYSVKLVGTNAVFANPYNNTPSAAMIMTSSSNYIFSPTRLQFGFDLSGIKYKSRQQLIDLQRSWETFERVENENNIVFQRLSLGLRDKMYYQFRTREEMNDYRTGQTNHILRYPWLPSSMFDSISIQSVPYITPLNRPPNYSLAINRGVLFSTAMTSSEYLAQQADLTIYTHVSSYNSMHTYKYIFPSNEEKMAYHRAELILLSGQTGSTTNMNN